MDTKKLDNAAELGELGELVAGDLAMMLAERFAAPARAARPPALPPLVTTPRTGRGREPGLLAAAASRLATTRRQSSSHPQAIPADDC